MTRNVLYSTSLYLLVSHGQGAAYAFTALGAPGTQDDLEVFVTGDDAEQFQHDLQSLERIRPREETDVTLGRLWDIYADAAEPAALELAA